MIFSPKIQVLLGALFTYSLSLFGAQEILILGEELSKKNTSSFLNILEVQDQDRSQSLADFLTHEKGITIKSQSGKGSLATANIRGIGKAEQVLILLDGVRLNTAQGSGVDLSRIPLSMVEKVEILRGGDSALYGTDAVGGVINLVTAHGKTNPTLIISKQTLSMTDYTVQGSLSRPTGPVTFYGSASSQKNPGDFFFVNPITNQTDQMKNNAFFSRGFFLKSTWSISEKATTSLMQEWYQAKKEVPGSLQWPTHDLQHDLRSISILSYQHAFLNHKTLTLNFPFRYNTLQYEDSFGTSLHKNYFLGPKASVQFPLGQSHLIQTVGEFTWDHLKSSYMNLSPSKTTYALAAKDDYYVTPKTTATFASRFEHSPNVYTTWVPKVGMSYAWSSSTLFKSNLSHSFRAPSFDERYVNFPMFQGNPELRPEKSFDGDVGFSVERLGFKVENTLFASYLKDLISQKMISPALTTLENKDKSFIWGREFSIDSVAPIWKSFYASFNHTWLRADLPYRPTNVLNSTLSWESSIYKISMTHQWTSHQYTSDATRPKLPASQVLDLASEYKIYKNLLFNIKVENLLNAPYERIAYYPMPGRTFTFQITGTL